MNNLIFSQFFKGFAALWVLLFVSLNSADVLANGGYNNPKYKKYLRQAYKKPEATPVIWIGDFNNFDDAVALILLAKDPRYRIDLIVVEDSFNTVAHSANMTYNILEWLGNVDTKVIRGAYFATEEIALGANGEASGSAINDEFSVPDQADYQLPNSSDFSTGQWNLERRNAMGINLYGQFVPGPWRDNGSTLYGTDHLIPRAKQKRYRYNGNKGVSFNFTLAEDIVLETLSQSERKVLLLNTGKLTTLARVLAKGSDTSLGMIERVLMMGGGFQGLAPFTADNAAACFGDKSLNLGGNIFSHPSFACDTDFSTHQEFNIFLDPASAKATFDLLAEKGISSYLVPTNATDSAKVQLETIDQLAAKKGTKEACYTARLLSNIREFEGGDFNDNGDFALDTVIRLWDIVAALLVLEPELITLVESHYVEVDQLDPGLSHSATPYDPISFDPTVGKTSLSEAGSGKKINVVLGIDIDATRMAMIERLRVKLNSAGKAKRCRI